MKAQVPGVSVRPSLCTDTDDLLCCSATVGNLDCKKIIIIIMIIIVKSYTDGHGASGLWMIAPNKTSLLLLYSACIHSLEYSLITVL